jgi:hypothetical protein
MDLKSIHYHNNYEWTFLIKESLGITQVRTKSDPQILPGEPNDPIPTKPYFTVIAIDCENKEIALLFSTILKIELPLGTQFSIDGPIMSVEISNDSIMKTYVAIKFRQDQMLWHS